MEADDNIVRFTYPGEEEIPNEATHIFITARVVPRRAFQSHPNIVEVICHENVKKIELMAFDDCPSLQRVIMPGVKEVEEYAFNGCEAMTHFECGKLEIVGTHAFSWCFSLRSIDLPSIKIIGEEAFLDCEEMENVKFGKDLESIRGEAFRGCWSLERIIIPLKDGMITRDNTFWLCENLSHIDLVGGVHETVAALLMEEWKDDMNKEIENISQILPNTPAGDWRRGHARGKARAIGKWIRSVLRKVVHYKAEHRRYLNIAAATLQPALPDDIVLKNVLPFLELPSHTFEGGLLLEDEDEPPAANEIAALPQDIVNMEEQVNHHFFDLSSVALSLVIMTVSILMGAIIYETISIWLEAKALTDADEL